MRNNCKNVKLFLITKKVKLEKGQVKLVIQSSKAPVRDILHIS